MGWGSCGLSFWNSGKTSGRRLGFAFIHSSGKSSGDPSVSVSVPARSGAARCARRARAAGGELALAGQRLVLASRAPAAAGARDAEHVIVCMTDDTERNAV